MRRHLVVRFGLEPYSDSDARLFVVVGFVVADGEEVASIGCLPPFMFTAERAAGFCRPRSPLVLGTAARRWPKTRSDVRFEVPVDINGAALNASHSSRARVAPR